MKEKIWLVLLFALILIDQFTKWILLRYPHFLNSIFSVTLNSKFILGYGPSFDLFFWISTLIILILALVIAKRSLWQNYFLSIMIAGAVSNLIDRFLRGGVVDYFKIHFIDYLNFNLADLYLIIGLFCYLYVLGRENEKKAEN